jgi:hypothetical protein
MVGRSTIICIGAMTRANDTNPPTRIDNGEPLLLPDPPEEHGAVAYAVSTAVCENPEW